VWFFVILSVAIDDFDDLIENYIYTIREKVREILLKQYL